jgi:RNA polymerase sigma-70 factor (ECF subfamily)
MKLTSARPADGVEAVLDKYGNNLYRICLITLKNQADAEDALQDTLVRYLQKAPRFESEEHQKAWLIRVAVNICRDMLRKRRYHQEELENIPVPQADEQQQSALDALLTLQEQFRIPMILHYVEGYSVAELAKLLSLTQSAVKMRLSKGRTLLREAVGKE